VEEAAERLVTAVPAQVEREVGEPVAWIQIGDNARPSS